MRPERSVWIARHASRLDFEDPSWRERAPRPHDPPLSGAGEREARALAQRLAVERVDALFASPFLRCAQTAGFAAEALGLAIRLEPGLSEWQTPEWFPEPPRLLAPAELASRGLRIDLGYRPRGGARYGESGIEALRRSGDTARRLVADFPGDLVLVGHGASVLGATAALLGIAPETVAETAPLPDSPYAGLVQLVAGAAGTGDGRPRAAEGSDASGGSAGPGGAGRPDGAGRWQLALRWRVGQPLAGAR